MCCMCVVVVVVVFFLLLTVVFLFEVGPQLVGSLLGCVLILW